VFCVLPQLYISRAIKRAVISRAINYADVNVDICYALGNNTKAMFACCVVGWVERLLIPL